MDLTSSSGARGERNEPATDRPSLHQVVAGPGLVRDWLRSRDWRDSPLGPPDTWSYTLRGAARICFDSSRPLLVAWGPEAVLIYNDAALPLLGPQHPSAFGAKCREARPDIWEAIEPATEAVLATGQPEASSDQLLLLERHGATEERYFKFHLSPILHEGTATGVLCSVVDTTAEVLARRRLATLARLADRMAAVREENEAWLTALDALERNPADLPFALLYETDAPDAAARLAGAVGVGTESLRALELVDPGASDAPWPFERVGRSLEPEQQSNALVLPVVPSNHELCGYLVAGLSPRQPLDDAYRSFLRSIAERVALGVGNARGREAGVHKAEALERVRAQLERRCAELTRLFEQAPVPITVLRGFDFVVEMANPAAQAVVGGRPMLGRPLLDAFPELAGQGFDPRLRAVLATGQPDVGREALVRLEHEGRIEDRYFTFISASLQPWADQSPGIVLVAIEVTEQVRSRAALRASEARYRGIFENVDVSIWEEDLAGVLPLIDELEAAGVNDLRAYFEHHAEFLDHALRRVSVTDVNEATLRMFGARDKDELRRSLHSVFLPETLRAFGEKLVALAEKRPLVRIDTVVRTLLGERREVMMSVALAGGNGRADKLLVTLMDITERKAMEQALREADRHKDEFLAMLAHELRNPLAPLRSSLDLLRTWAGEVPAGDVLDIIERQVDHLARLADDLFETSRIQRGTFDLRRQRVLLADVVRNALEASEPLIRAAGHHFDVELPTEPLWLDGDPTRLAQVLANLLNNAARYTRAAGRISLTARRSQDIVEIRVADTGIGIAPNALPGLFRMFSRIEAPDEAGSAGLGIGLALARQLVEAHGGTIGARSEGAGKGSEFIVRLPVTAVREDGIKPRERPAEPIADCRILVVEDNRDAAASLRMLLEANGADVRVADSGPRALTLFDRFHPDVVLLDIAMPGMSGYEVARRLRAEFPDRPALLVALTGWGREEDVQRAREAGFDHHLLKPVNIGRLRSLLAQMHKLPRGRGEGR